MVKADEPDSRIIVVWCGQHRLRLWNRGLAPREERRADMKHLTRWPAMVLVFGLLSACQTIAPFRETAYRMATSLKVESLNLMSRAAEPYAAHAPEVAVLKLELDKAYEYARGRPNNAESIGQWEILLDPNRHLLGGFLRRWQAEGQLSPHFVEEARGEVAKGFRSELECAAET